MIRAILPIACLIHAGCYATTSYRAADPDTLDHSDRVALERCRAECIDAADQAGCFAACPSVTLADGTCDESDLPDALCVEQRRFDSVTLRQGIGLFGGAASLVVAVLYMRGIAIGAEAAAEALFPPREL